MSQTLMQRVRSEGAPVIDGATATFVWQGSNPPSIVGDFNGWNSGSQAGMAPIGENDWSLSIELPVDAYVEYALVSDQGRFLDPFNPRKTPNGFGNYNIYFYMFPAGKTGLARRKPGIPHGRVFTQELTPSWYLSSKSRRVHFYQPPVSKPCLFCVYQRPIVKLSVGQ